MKTASRTRYSRLTSVVIGDCKAILLRDCPLSTAVSSCKDFDLYWPLDAAARRDGRIAGLDEPCHAFDTDLARLQMGRRCGRPCAVSRSRSRRPVSGGTV